MAETWKFFLVEITYLRPAEELGELVGQHRAYLQSGYERGWLLLSGPQVPRTGGLVVARAPSQEDLEAFFAQDPYQVNRAATYRVVEFNPILRQAFLEDWVSGK